MKKLVSVFFALVLFFSFSVCHAEQTIDIRDIVSVLSYDNLLKLNDMVDEYLVEKSGKTAFQIRFESLSYDELVQLKDHINQAMWNSQEWQEVTVPIGVWTVGEDIPVAHWSISIAPGSSRKWVAVTYCDLLNEAGTDAGNQFSCKIYSYQTIGSADNENYPQTIDLDLKPNTYIIVEKGSVVFTPYTGKPDLGFK